MPRAVTDVLRGILGQEGAATNPVARSLSARGSGTAQRDQPDQRACQPDRSRTPRPARPRPTARPHRPATARPPASSARQTAPTPQGFATPDLTVQPAPDINAIVVRGTPTAIAGIERLIPELDVRRPQVLIEAAIAEITGDDAEQLAIQLGTSGAALNAVEGVGTSFSSPGPSLGTVLDAARRARRRGCSARG